MKQIIWTGLLLVALTGLFAQQPSGKDFQNFNPRFEVFTLPGGALGNSVQGIVQDSTGSNVPLAVILPACDGDVIDLAGQHFFEAVRLADARSTRGRYTNARPSFGLACRTNPFSSKIRMVVNTVLYASSTSFGSNSATSATVEGPRSHSTSISRNSASVNPGDRFLAKLSTLPATKELRVLAQF